MSDQTMPATVKSWSLTPTSLGEALKFGEMLATSGVVPEVYRNNPAGIVAACEQGSHLGFTAMQSLQSIAVINGMPSLWGDALPALAMQHPAFESIDETFDEDALRATCKIKRKGMALQTRTFSWADAERAGLTGKDTYKKYPQRMLKARARAWAIRDVFPDALKGCQVVEEVRDIPANAATDADYRNVVVDGEAETIVEPEKPATGMDALGEALEASAEPEPEAEAEADAPDELDAAIADWKAKMDECADYPALERVGHELFDMDDGPAKAALRTYFGTRKRQILGSDDAGETEGEPSGDVADET